MNEIQSWLDSKERKYEDGIDLLTKYSRKRRLIAVLSRRNDAPARQKLVKELAKISASFKRIKGKVKEKPLPKAWPSAFKIGPPADEIGVQLDGEDPKELRALKLQYRDLYKQRSDFHKELREMPQENSDELKAKRKQISENMKQISSQMDELFGEIENFEVVTKPVKKDDSPPPADGAAMVKRKKNLESSLAKDRNQLFYQEKTKQDKENPMPEGPKREAIEKRIAEKEAELKELNEKLQS